jgi:GntR family transcriptional regulator, transcriptional repressor for pyruvate dehydrogenase complex
MAGMTNIPSDPGTGQVPTMLYERIANQVRDLITSRNLGPGDRLPTERELAEMLGVSRVPIREAVRTLSAQGVVEVRRGRGMFVASRGMEATIEELTSALLKQRDIFNDLFAVRRLLEPAAAQWAAANRVDPEDADKLEGIVKGMEAIGRAKRPDLDAMAELDAQFHVEIAACANNTVMLRLMQALQDLHREQLETSLRYRGRLPETIMDHRRIVDAVVAQDPVGASLAMTDHLARSEAATIGRLEGQAD